MHTRKEYLAELWKEYEKASRTERSRLLDEAEKRTRLNRKYLIRVLNRRPQPRRVKADGVAHGSTARRC